ncbi:MAG: FAD-dependent oxidoreductase [Caulobacteraceae bacterium]|nr:FAD-dependent oxidoreductase [Caulobacteraceae bacterium]
MAERVAVLGAGMAGLCVALALAPTGREITLYERDPPPPEGGAEAAFEGWARRGVGHLRHSHAFLARLRNLIRAEHPGLLEDLRAAGARELTFAEGLPGPLRDRYVAEPGDEELAVIVSRRTTMELVIRRYVERRNNVTLRSGMFVQGLVTEPGAGGGVAVRGLNLAGESDALAEIVIDAGGRASPAVEWLRDAGATIPEEEEDCAILYYTRFYRHEPGAGEPPRGRFGVTGDLGYLKFAVFPADNATFSITVAVPQVEEALRAAVVRPEVFDRICARLPGIAPWTDPARASPISRVHGMGDLKSRWREMAPEGTPVTLNWFAVGDSLARTNPLFGRGCSFAAAEAHLLRDALSQTTDPAERARLYSHRVRAALRPYYDDMRAQDRSAARRALHGLDPGYRRPWRARLKRRLLEDGITIALRRDPVLLRAAMRAFHMLEPPQAWLTRPATLAKVLATWARGRRANAPYYAEKSGPGRTEMFADLGLPAGADLARLRAAG